MRPFDAARIWESLCGQTRAFVHDAGFQDVLIGLSGGLDSSLVAAIAASALGADHVHGLIMSGPYTSEDSRKDASELARRLGITTAEVPITATFAAFAEEWEAHLGEPLRGLAAENTQARLRMCILMALSNERGWLVLNTGNLSEAAMGYSTLYGDTAGAFAPIGGVYKTEAFTLARYANAQAEERGEVPPIPDNVLSKPPSAELASGQTDEASLGMGYPELDGLLSKMLDEGILAAEISPQAEKAWERYERNAFKRAQEPPFATIQD